MIEAAIEIGSYLIEHSRFAYRQMGADPVVADAKFILRGQELWLERVPKTGTASSKSRKIQDFRKPRLRTPSAYTARIHSRENFRASVRARPKVKSRIRGQSVVAEGTEIHRMLRKPGVRPILRILKIVS